MIALAFCIFSHLLIVASAATGSTRPSTVRPAADGDVRLEDGHCESEGRLEVYHAGVWGTVCNDKFTALVAQVVCRQLGYTSGTVMGELPGTGRIWLDDLVCSFSDRRLVDCSHRPWGVHDCGHNEDVKLACHNTTRYASCSGEQGITSPGEGVLRLMDGPCPSEGRLEIYHAGRWGTICDDGFGIEEALIACRELGFDTGTPIRPSRPGTGVIWLDDLACTSSHKTIAECGQLRWGREDCGHTEDTGLNCYNYTATEDCHGNPVPDDGAIRLSGGTCNYEGRLEIYHQRRWGTICNDKFNNTAAELACKELGFRTGWTHAAPSGDGLTIWLKSVMCSGSSPNISSCSHAPWGNAHGCMHAQDVGLLCSNDTTRRDCRGDLILHQDGDLRLVDGGCPSEGRLEVFHGGRWGTVCDDSFTTTAATVACRQLGYQNGYMTPAKPGTGPTWLDNVVCPRSDIARLAECQHATWGVEDCSHSEDVGVQCFNGSGSRDCNGNLLPQDGAIRLHGGRCKTEGRLEIFHNGKWGSVCDEQFTDQSSSVACREMGFSTGLVGVAGRVNETTSPVWLSQVRCRTSDTSLVSCPHSAWASTGCTHLLDVFLTCSASPTPKDCNNRTVTFHEGGIRMVGGRNLSTGRLEVFHEGRWGTVCDDAFDTTDATVACRELGFHKGVMGPRGLAPSGTGRTWMDQVECEPSNTKLSQCDHAGWGREDCGHEEDVRLNCSNETECDSNPCRNGGKCVTGFNTFTCTCTPGYTGDLCGSAIDECESSPCQNAGTCADRHNGFTCTCVAGYTGTDCSIDINDCASYPCLNAAHCVDKVDGYSCQCAPGFVGVNCDTNVNECASLPCHNGGVCHDKVNDFSCKCPAGFQGRLCQIDRDECVSNPCRNNGTCVQGDNWYICICQAGYQGVNCEGKVIATPPSVRPKPAEQSSTKVPKDATGVAGVAIGLSVIAIIAVIVLVVSWMLLGRKRGSSSGSLVKEDEMAVWSGETSDKVNLVT